jgi:hypothetical protein
MSQYIRLLSDMSFSNGLIGYPEYIERLEVADWLDDSRNQIPDPRLSSDEKEETEESFEENSYREDDHKQSDSNKSGNEDPDWLEFLMLSEWMFTVGDADCYPSVPHGHYKSKTRAWPKLNPYTGRAFSSAHNEDKGKRLDKKGMIKLWNSPKFIEHCREQVLWYSNFAPNYIFSRAKRGKLAFPKWK